MSAVKSDIFACRFYDFRFYGNKIFGGKSVCYHNFVFLVKLKVEGKLEMDILKCPF